MQTIEIDTWDQFIRLTGELDGWAFRGQRNAAWPLISSLSRHLMSFVPQRSLWVEREARSIRVFRRKAHNYLNDPQVLEDPLRCLALMQHHGAPTRLLDFTKSPFVAAYFALERSTEPSAVFALNTPAIWDLAPTDFPGLSRDEVDPRDPERFKRYFTGTANPVVWTGEPNQLDRRLVAQSGMFVLPGAVDETIDKLLEGYSSPSPLILKYSLSPDMRLAGMRELYRMNITYATLFPDLDGLARSMAFELETEWHGLTARPAP